MSKHNNVNPDFYYDGDRNRQGEGIVHEKQKQALQEESQRHVQSRSTHPAIVKSAKKK